MKNIFLIYFLLFFTIIAYAQKPDYKKIEKEVRNKRSSLYYPKLLKRFYKADTTLTLEEKRHLYYGFQFQKEYNPYVEIPYAGSLKNIENREELIKDDKREIISYSDSVWDQDPINIRLLNYRLYNYTQLGEFKKIEEAMFQLQTVIAAVMSSGNGQTEDTAFYVIRTSDEYELLQLLDFEYKGGKKMINLCDYLPLTENPFKVKGLYFNISAGLNFLNKNNKK